MKPLAPGRVRCCIPFCGRTFKQDPGNDGEVMCGKHFRLADDNLRRMFKLAWRRYRAGKIDEDLAARLIHRLFEKIKAQAATRG